MIRRIEYLKDTLGNNYLGLAINPIEVEPYLEKLKAILGEQYEIYTGNQKNRDLGKYHITVINVMDYNSLINRLGIDTFVNSLEVVFDFEIDDVKMIGIGKAEKAGNTAYFVVIRSEKLDAIRNKYELPEQDFHITIGFKYKDVFGVRKNEVIKDTDGFLDILSHIYFKNHESFDFIKELDNFEGDTELEIEPIKIEKTNATFRNGVGNYFTIALVENSLRVVAQWGDDSNKPILARTLVARKLKEKN
jgi:hypothetical protein